MTPRAWFDPRGRLSRPLYARLVVRLALAATALLCAAILLGAQGWRAAAFGPVAGITALALAGIAQTTRRLHDRGRSGWWLLPAVVLFGSSYLPVETLADAYPLAVVTYAAATVAATLWFLIETLGRRGTPGSNRYGPAPDERA